MKIKRTSYENEKTILMFAGVDFVGVPVTISDSGIVANEDGKKLVPRGTIVSVAGVAANTADAYGVLMNTADVTYGPRAETVVIEGHINAENLPEMPAAEAITALKNITFHNVQ